MLSTLSRLFRVRRPAEPVWIETDALRRQLTANAAPITVIDVREPAEFSSPPGHLPGAINVPLSTLPTRLGEIAARKQPVVLVCKTDRRSAKAAELLLAQGVPAVTVLRGGTDGWHNAGLPLE